RQRSSGSGPGTEAAPVLRAQPVAARPSRGRSGQTGNTGSPASRLDGADMSPAFSQRTPTWVRSVGRSVLRVGWPATDKDSAAEMISTLFLHIHPARVSRHVLKFSWTFALGLIAAILFL